MCQIALFGSNLLALFASDMHINLCVVYNVSYLLWVYPVHINIKWWINGKLDRWLFLFVINNAIIEVISWRKCPLFTLYPYVKRIVIAFTGWFGLVWCGSLHCLNIYIFTCILNVVRKFDRPLSETIYEHINEWNRFSVNVQYINRTSVDKHRWPIQWTLFSDKLVHFTQNIYHEYTHSPDRNVYFSVWFDVMHCSNPTAQRENWIWN